MSNKPDVLLTRAVYPGTVETLEREFTLHKLWTAPDQDKMIADLAPTLRVIAGGYGCNATLLSKFPKLGLVANFGVGYDTIDVDYCAKHGIHATNSPDVLNDEVADTAMGLLLCTARKLVVGDRYVREGKWLKGAMPLTTNITGKTMGIVGLGRIGEAVASRAIAHKMNVVYHNRSKKDVPYKYYPSLVEMARDVDVLMVIIPGGAETAKLISREVLEALGPSGILINVARGTVVDEPAMVELLKSGKLGAAGLDVFEKEPEVPQGLIELTENVVLQPHVGSATHATRTAMGQLMIDNIKAFLAGQPLLTEVPETKGK
ncbi:2-hydroxyacid dehydrogenase [Oceanibaculum pacificum]|uniref:Hydroxyacid dehydrogenase n=1 Tax=Oceanibaculum pacificum TaxID=580166 RepID=A0A154VXR5_9PROT|nr:2-hydroxyacid dehydrogenase [Oceanibaculum pacificum]KZD05999.1 hydroxyacid dehydrogenase [Oceanibaculum pacificum]